MNKISFITDAAESIFFAKELESVKAKTYDVKYPVLKARTLFPVSMEAGAGAETITYEQYDEVGMAKIIASYADDLPRADVKGKQFTSPIKSLGASYGYNFQEIRAAKMAGKPLTQRKASAAKKAILFKENDIAFKGDATTGLQGFLTHPNIPLVTIAADGTGALTTFASKTPAQILRDLHKIVNSVPENTFEIEYADTLLMPLTQYNYIKTTPWSQTGTPESILEVFLKQSDTIKNVVPVYQLKGAGAGATDRMAVYRRDSEVLTLEIPQDFEQFPEQERNLEAVVPCHSRTGGVIVYYPMACAFVDGI